MGGFRPTPQQQAAVEAFTAGAHVVLQAGAGSGKTSTLQLLGEATRRRGRYLAFNKSIATEAQRRFPRTVTASTVHKLGYAAVGHQYRERLTRPRMASAKLASIFGIRFKEVWIGQRRLTAAGVYAQASGTVLRFCQSADTVIRPEHVPWPRGISEEHEHDQLVDLVLPYAQRIWDDLQDPHGGRARFTHDHYLKMWALTEPRLRDEFLLIDEAQDTNPVAEQVFTAQRDRCQLVMVGDSAQAIYGWRGARDIMAGAAGTHLNLSQSFRFGNGIAAEANRWLAIADAPIRLTGAADIDSGLDTLDKPEAILCRTNGGAIIEVLDQLKRGRRVCFVGRADDLRRLAGAARDLQNGLRTDHPDLMLFANWGEVQDYVDYDPDGRDLLPLVEVIDEHGVDVVLDTLGQLSAEAEADVTVSTVHAAKGREWSTVRIAEDFIEPLDEDTCDAAGNPQPAPIEPAEANLAYVAVTRARHRLDLGGLAWINRHPDGNPTQANRA